MPRLLARFLRRSGPYGGWTPLLLTLAAVACLPAALMLVGRPFLGSKPVTALGPITGSLLALTILAVLAGLRLARSSFSAGTAAVLGGLLGGGLVATLIGRLIPPLPLLWTELGFAVEWLLQRGETLTGQRLPLALAAASLWQQLSDLGFRLRWDLESIVLGGSLWDTTAYLLLAAFLLWSIGLFAAWRIYRRRSALVGLLPSGTILSIVTFFHPQAAVYLFIYLFCTLWLLAACQLWARWERWEESKTDYPDDIGTELAMSLAPWILAVIMLAAFFPTTGFWKVSHAFWDGMEAVFGPFEGGYAGGPGSGEGLPRSHLLGSGAELGRNVVLYVASNDPPPPLSDAEKMIETGPEPPRRYWRGATYDVYTGRGWTNSPLETRTVSPGQPLESNAPAGFELRQDFDLIAPDGESLYAANSPWGVDHAVETRWRSAGDLAEVIRSADRYTVISRPPESTIPELRARPPAATTLLPELAERYLALPDTLPQRVRELAEQVTSGAEADYDKALAIETYLRTYPYTLDLPQPPDDRDVVDYFLFDLQEGYCDYYASAMVVMARAVGVPARFATGYAQGSYDYDTRRWVVTEKDSHSWVEVYFDGLGWVEFEPTAGQRALTRPGGQSARRPLVPPLPPRPVRWWQQVPWSLLAMGAVLVLLVAIVVWIWLPGQRRDAMADELVRDRHWRLTRWGARLGQPLRDGQTPQEYGTTLNDALHARGQASRWSAVRQAGTQAPAGVEHLTDAFIRAQYGSQPITNRESWQIRELWTRLRRWLWWLWLERK